MKDYSKMSKLELWEERELILRQRDLLRRELLLIDMELDNREAEEFKSAESIRDFQMRQGA